MTRKVKEKRFWKIEDEVETFNAEEKRKTES